MPSKFTAKVAPETFDLVFQAHETTKSGSWQLQYQSCAEHHIQKRQDVASTNVGETLSTQPAPTSTSQDDASTISVVSLPGTPMQPASASSSARLNVMAPSDSVSSSVDPGSDDASTSGEDENIRDEVKEALLAMDWVAAVKNEMKAALWPKVASCMGSVLLVAHIYSIGTAAPVMTLAKAFTWEGACPASPESSTSPRRRLP